MSGRITSKSGETWSLPCYGRGRLYLPPSSYRPIGRIKPPRENASIHTSARTSSLVEVRCTEARLLTRCHRITGGYFPDVDLLRECHRSPAPELDEKLRKNASVVAATRALTDTTGAHRFWRYERLLTMALQARKEYRSDAKFKRYRVHSPHLPETQFRRMPNEAKCLLLPLRYHLEMWMCMALYENTLCG